MLFDPLGETFRCSLLMSFLAVGPGGTVDLSMTVVTECLEVGPLKAEVAALLLGTATLHFHYVMHAAGGHHVTLGLTALTKGIGSELGLP